MEGSFSDHLLFHLINYAMAAVMYTMVGQSILGVFIGFYSNFFVMRFFRKITDPFVRLFSVVTPRFLVPPLVPLYLAFILLVLRIGFTLIMLNMGMAPRALD